MDSPAPLNWENFDRLYARRHEARSLESCRTLLSEKQTDCDAQFEANWRLARLESFCGLQTLENGDHKTARAHFDKGRFFAKEALRSHPQRVEGVFWSVTCQLESLRLQSKFAVVRVLGRAQADLRRACARDETFHFAGPLRVLGRLTHLKPAILGGNLDHAITLYEKALISFPCHSTTLLYLADALLHARQSARARVILRAILEQSDSTNWVWETQRDQKEAQLWLQSRFD